MSSVIFERVVKRFDDFTALQSLDLRIEESEFLTLLGPSGCGKTTTLRLIAGFTMPSEGRICLGDTEITHLAPQDRNVGMVFQDYALFPHLTVAENIAFGLVERRVDKATMDARVNELLDFIELPGVGERYPAQISGGQRQRIAVARAVACTPRVLLMDEPLGALDLKLRETMQVELRRIQQELGITAVYVTHDQDEALSMADRIAVMRDGSIEQIGSPHELYNQPANRFVAQFMGETNLIEGTVVSGDDPIVVKTALGMFNITSGKTPAQTGDSVYCSIRPEKIACIENTDAAQNTFAGTIEEVFFLGDHEQYRVVSASGEVLQVSNRDSRSRVKGTGIRLGFGPDDVVVLHGN